MRVELSQLKNIDRGIAIACLTVVIAIGVGYWMFGDLAKLQAGVDSLSRDVNTKRQQVSALPPPSAGDGTDPEVRLNSIVASADVPMLFQEISKLASDNNLEGVNIGSEDRDVDVSAPEGQQLQSLGIVRYTVITVTFKAEYEDVSRFLGAVSQIPQSLLVRAVDIHRDIPKVNCSVLLQVYQKGA